MSWYHTVDPRRIHDPRVRTCTPLARLLWVHLLVGEAASRVPGLARGGPGALGEALGVAAEVADAAIRELEAVCAVLVDRDERLIRLIGVAVDHAGPARSPQTCRHWLKHAGDLPRSAVAVAHFRELAEICRSSGNEQGARDWEAMARGMSAESCSKGHILPSASPREGPSMPVPCPLDQRSGSDRDQDHDRDSPPTPPGGEERERAVIEACLEALRVGARRLGTTGPQGVTPAERRKIRRLDSATLRGLPDLARRQVARVERDLASGRDFRHLLTLADVLREAPRLAASGHLDHPARAPPSGRSQPAMFETPE